MKAIRLCSLALVMALSGCAPKWVLGDNTVSPGGELAFYNGVTINYPGQMQVVSEKMPQTIGDQETFVSLYMLNHNQAFGYLAMQVSAASGFKDMMGELSDETLTAFATEFTSSMLEKIKQQNPALPVIGPTVTRQDYRSSSGKDYRIIDLNYISAGNGKSLSILIKVIITQHDLIAIMSFTDNNQAENIAEAVFRSIQCE